jgi:Astacin (Peptidase family M12A)
MALKVSLLVVFSLAARALPFERSNLIETAEHKLPSPLMKGGDWQDDILLSPEQKLAILSARSSNTGALDLALRWPKIGGYVWVPYAFSSSNFSEFLFDEKVFLTTFKSLATDHKTIIREGLREIEKKTCVRFLPRTLQTDYVAITNGVGCWSNLGRIKRNQTLSLAISGCVTRPIVIHEFMHVLGFDHQHNRADRDSFIALNFTKMNYTMQASFTKVNPVTFGDFNTTYDYLSIMHYARDSGSLDGTDTVTPRNMSFIDLIGKVQHASDGDITRINNMYNCTV